jgi:hypothetical protein
MAKSIRIKKLGLKQWKNGKGLKKESGKKRNQMRKKSERNKKRWDDGYIDMLREEEKRSDCEKNMGEKQEPQNKKYVLG